MTHIVDAILAEGVDSAAVYLALSKSGLPEHHFLYASDSETRIAIGCTARVSVDGDRVTLQTEDGQQVSEPASDPFEQVPRLLASASTGGDWTAYGHVSFDIARHYLPYGHQPEVPELVFTIPKAELIISGRSVRIVNGSNVAGLFAAVEAARVLPDAELPAPFVPFVDHALAPDYQDKVRELTRAIHEGNLSKAILSRRVVFDGQLDVPGTYAVASRINTGIRSFGFRADRIASVGFSPEVLLEASAGTVTTALLAGTRRRGADVQEDDRLQAELLASAKEVKEHAMSVQLAQEEIRSVCRPSSVRIFEFMNIKKFRTVQHLGSKVSGQLLEGLSAWDALRVLFPAITVAGVPKSAALRWIGDLEEHPRGIYGGVVGYVDSKGNVDLALAIRSAFEYRGQVQLCAGAGIVGESDPEFEYTESVNKMKMMLGQTVLTGSPVQFQASGVGK